MGCVASSEVEKPNQTLQAYTGTGSESSAESISTTEGSRDRSSTTEAPDFELSEEEIEELKRRYKESRTRAQTVATTDADRERASVDSVFQSQLKLMRKYYSWDEIPMEFFVDKYVDEEGRKGGKLRPRLSVAKKARPVSMRPRRPKPSNERD